MAEAGPLGRTQAIRILQMGRTPEELIATIRTLHVRRWTALVGEGRSGNASGDP